MQRLVLLVSVPVSRLYPVFRPQKHFDNMLLAYYCSYTQPWRTCTSTWTGSYMTCCESIIMSMYVDLFGLVSVVCSSNWLMYWSISYHLPLCTAYSALAELDESKLVFIPQNYKSDYLLYRPAVAATGLLWRATEQLSVTELSMHICRQKRLYEVNQ